MTADADGRRREYLAFDVAGVAAPQGSKRYLGNGRLVESSKRVGAWRADVRQAAHQAVKPEHANLWDAPVKVTINFYLPRPKSHYRTGRNAGVLRDSAPTHPAGTPDLDKLARAVLDALTGIVWADDSRVVHLDVQKQYTANQPCAYVWVWTPE